MPGAKRRRLHPRKESFINRPLGTLSAAIGISLFFASAVSSQTPTAQSTQTTAPTTSDESTRPATTTFFGDTGLWFVPTPEVLPYREWSVSGYRAGTDYVQGHTNVGDFAGTGTSRRRHRCLPRRRQTVRPS